MAEVSIDLNMVRVTNDAFVAKAERVHRSFWRQWFALFPS